MVNHRSPKPELQVRFLPLLPETIPEMPFPNPIAIFRKVPVFFGEVKAELVKVSWPTRKDLLGAASITIVVTAILTLFIAILDFALSKGVTMVLK